MHLVLDADQVGAERKRAWRARQVEKFLVEHRHSDPNDPTSPRDAVGAASAGRKAPSRHSLWRNCRQPEGCRAVALGNAPTTNRSAEHGAGSV